MYRCMSRLSIVPTSPKESKPQEEIEYCVLFNEQRGLAKETRDKGIHLPSSTQKKGPVSFTQGSEHLLGAMLICQGRVTATRLEQTRAEYPWRYEGRDSGPGACPMSPESPLPPALSMQCLWLVLPREVFLHASSHGTFLSKHTHSFYIVAANADRLWSIFS